MDSLFTMADDDILRAAAQIVATRQHETKKARAAETQRLFKTYAAGRLKTPHPFGKPQALTQEEALLLFALEHNRYVVEVEAGSNGRWSGSAFCQYNVREGAISMRAESRHDLLLSLWASVSDQEGDSIAILEDHLKGTLVQAQLRQLWKEVKEQESTHE